MILKIIKIKGIAKADLQNAVEKGPNSLNLTKIGLIPRQLAPIININATNQIDGLEKFSFKTIFINLS